MQTLIRTLLIFLTCGAFGEQRVVLISGASQGIGLATAKAFHDTGWKVWAGYRSQIPEAWNEMENLRPVRLDVTKEQDVQEAIQTLLKEEGKLDALVNNAGYILLGTEESASIEEAEELFDVNFFGALRLIQAVLPSMRAQHSGHIINISSTSGIRAIPGFGLYAASKFALEGMSESLAATLSPWNIQVALVEPGMVNNEILKHVIYGTRECEDDLVNATLCKTLIERNARLALNGQNCEEIGSLIVQVAENPKPNMRYQTSEKVKETAAKKLVDLSGNVLRDEQIALFDALLQSNR